jgi:hypothetical protein
MQVIRVSERARDLEAVAHNRFSEEYEQRLERVLSELFDSDGGCAEDDLEAAADAFDAQVGREGVVSFCLERGFDVRKDPDDPDGPLVACWRDVGIMLLARDRGLLG